jgi:hypothetical protein
MKGQWQSASAGGWIPFADLDNSRLDACIGVCSSVIRLSERAFLMGEITSEEMDMCIHLMRVKKNELLVERRARQEMGAMDYIPTAMDKIVPVNRFKSSHLKYLRSLLVKVKKILAESEKNQTYIQEVEESKGDVQEESISYAPSGGASKYIPWVNRKEGYTYPRDGLIASGLPWCNVAECPVYNAGKPYRYQINKIMFRNDVVLVSCVRDTSITLSVTPLSDLPEGMNITEENVLSHTDHELTRLYALEWEDYIESMNSDG